MYRTTKAFLRAINHDAIIAMIRDRTTHTSGQLLTTSELATFVHHPNTAPVGRVALTPANSRPAPERLRQDGFGLGTNDYTGTDVILCQPDDQPNRNNWHIGASRKGKSTLLLHRCRHLAFTGQGVGLIDPHQTAAFELLGTR